MPFYTFKTGPFFGFRKSRSPCRKKMIFHKHAKQPPKTHFHKLKTVPIKLRNMLGPMFNLYLDQFLTFKMCTVFAGNPHFYRVFSKKQNSKKHKKEKETLLVNTPVLTVLVKMSVFFCIFHFGVFRDVLLGSQNKRQTPKQHKQKTTTRKQDAKENYIIL